MKLKILILAVFLLQLNIQAQETNKIKYTTDFQFNDGLYLNFQEVKANKPISAAKIQTDLDENNFDFYEKLTEEKSVFIYDDLGNLQEIETEKIWGYAQNGKLFINVNDEFNRIPYFGNISHFLADITVYRTSPTATSGRYYSSNSSYYPTTKSTETRQYILDFSDGKVYEYDFKNVELVLMKDQQLYDEYNNLSKRKKKKLKFLYIRKYNERNPIYFPKN